MATADYDKEPPPTGELTIPIGAENWQYKFASWAVALGMAVIWMLLIWGVHRNSPRTLVSFHGYIHAAIGERFIAPASAAFPPENPFFAGEPVAYYWFFQFLGARLASLLNWNIFYGLEAVILAASGLLMVASVYFGRVLHRSTLAGALIGYLVVAGTNPFGFVLAAAKVIVQGAYRLNDDPNFLWGVVHPIYSLIRYNDIGGLYGPLLNFFLNMTSRPVALSLLMALLLALYNSLWGRGLVWWVLLGIAAALTASFSPIIGISAGGSLLAALVAAWLWQRRSGGTATFAAGGSTPLYSALAILTGLLIASPTYYHLLLGPSDSQMQFWFSSLSGMVRHLLTLGLAVVPLLLLALIGLQRSPPPRRSFLTLLLFAALLLLTAAAVLRLPSANESNFFHASVILVAVPAAASILRPKSSEKTRSKTRSRWAGAIVLFFLPTSLLLLSAYINRPPVPLTFDDIYPLRQPQDSDLAQLYRWAREESEPEAVFVIDTRQRVATNGNIAEFPALTGRVIFTEHTEHYMVSPYPDSDLRFDTAVQLVTGNKLGNARWASLQELNRPLFLVSYEAEDQELTNRLQNLYGPPVFRGGMTVIVFSLND